MPKYRKKPVVIEARQLRGPEWTDPEALAAWCGGVFRYASRGEDEPFWAIDIPTLEGTMTARFGDYVIKGVQGEFYPCKPDIFEATDEQVES